jgi:protein-S-isoprenylcysteine O-methyltransferase Ste14
MTAGETTRAFPSHRESHSLTRGRRPNPIAIVVAVWLGGWGLGFVGFSIAIPVALGWTGLFLLAIGFLLGLPALRGMVRAGTSPNPNLVPSSLVTTGIYRYTRNPMYLGMLLLYSGGALLASSVGAFLLLPVTLLLLDRWVVAPEERLLGDLFCSTYTEYLNRVPRWL